MGGVEGGHDMQKTASTNSSVKAPTSPSDVKSFKSRGLGDTRSLWMSRMVEDLRARRSSASVLSLSFFFFFVKIWPACVRVSVCICVRARARVFPA